MIYVIAPVFGATILTIGLLVLARAWRAISWATFGLGMFTCSLGALVMVLP